MKNIGYSYRKGIVMDLINILPEEIIRKIYSQLSPNDRTNFRCCNKEIASMCPAIPSNAFLTDCIPLMLRNEQVCCKKYSIISLSKLTKFIDESPQLEIYRNASSYLTGIYLIYNNIEKIAPIIGPCIHFILYNCEGYNQIICNWKYCNDFIIATSSKFSNLGTVIAMFLSSIFYKQ
jgi:hypothetical protein